MLIADRYRVVELLGEGGMGQVWRGEDLRLGRSVAVKVLQQQLMHGSVRGQALVRFEREARAAAQLAHRNIAGVHDVGEHDGMPYLVLEYLHGPDLKSLLHQNPDGLPIEQVLEFGAQAAEGLAAAHTAGIVHRDVKPHNLMLTADGTVKVCDFGIARLRDATSGLTGGATIDTVAYMAPEQVMGEPADYRTDLYALGATIFQLLTGRQVFTGGDARVVVAQHLAAPPPLARTLRADTPPELETLLQDLLSKEPGERPPDAAAVAERLLDLWRQRTDSDHPVNTLRARLGQAIEQGRAGRHDVAVTLLQSLVPDCQHVLGPEHPRTLAARYILADWTGKAGDPAAARDQLTQLLPIRERINGPEHAYTLTIRNNLADWTGKAGDPAAARDQLTQLLPVRERTNGPEHPHTLTIRNNLAHWTGKTGDPAAARDQLTQLLPIRERILGPEHPETLTTRKSLAHWTGEAGDPAAARDQFTQLLPVRERILGPEHPETLDIRNNLAHWTGEAGDPAAARDQFTQLLPRYERALGPEHTQTLTTRNNLAHWTGEAGDPAAARDQLTQLLPIRERINGPEHPETLDIRNNLAHWTGEAGDPAAARDQFTRLLPTCERVLGPKHLRTLAARNNLAYWTGVSLQAWE